jgi:hypothetical protein
MSIINTTEWPSRVRPSSLYGENSNSHVYVEDTARKEENIEKPDNKGRSSELTGNNVAHTWPCESNAQDRNKIARDCLGLPPCQQEADQKTAHAGNPNGKQ